ncbi:MAG: DsbE family thiol:disulfide interchange protein [Pseudomonadota bacterium]
MRAYIYPLAGFGLLVALLAAGLGLKPAEVPSPLIGKTVPAFELAQLGDPAQTVSPRQFAGKVWLLNVWASWCGACRLEHGALLHLATRTRAPIVGLNYKDARADGQAWLGRFGDPYAVSAFDAGGRVGMDFGVYGVPETFVIDRRGIVRYKLIGGLTPETVDTTILPLISELEHE